MSPIASSSSPLQVTPVSITYFDPFDLFPSVKNEISNIFPLENLHWKSPQGPIRTIPKLSVTFTPESTLLDTHSLLRSESCTDSTKPTVGTTATTTSPRIPQDKLPFIKFIIVNCLSIEEYRAKVRPLIRNWLPDETSSLSSSRKLISKPIIFLYANSEILDLNLFKSVSILDKFNKDFPQIQTLELKSVYKSPREKEEFWSQLGQQIKTTLLSIFQTRLQLLQEQLSKFVQSNTENELLRRLRIQEELLQLYTMFGLFEEGMEQCYIIEKEFEVLCRRWAKEIPVGKLEVPFVLASPESIADMFENGWLSEFLYLKYFFVSKLTLLNLEGNGSLFNPPITFLKAYKLVRQFLTNIDRMFSDDVLVLKFKYLFLGSIIDLVRFEEALKVPVLSEALAELILLQRDCWVNGVLASTDYKLMDKDYPNLTRGIKYEFTGPKLISRTYRDEDTFYNTFMEFNKRLVTLYNSCDGKRRRTIDILSIEIGMLHYQKGEYRDAVDLFCSCYEYYIQTNWDCIGLHLLRTFVNSLINCPDIKVLGFGDQKSEIPVSTVLGNAFLDILKMSRFDNEEDKTIWWDKFLNLERSNNDYFIYPSAGLLETTIDLNSLDLVGPNVYGITINLGNTALPGNVSFNSIRLTLRAVTSEPLESRKLLVFESSKNTDLNLKCGKNTYILETRSISFGKYEVVSLDIQVDSHTIFIEEFPRGQCIDVHRLYDKSNVSVEVTQSNSLMLGSSSFIDVKLANFETLKSSQLTIRAISRGKNESPGFHSSDVPISFREDDGNLKEITFSNLQKDTKVPYYITDTIDKFSLEVKIIFEKYAKEGDSESTLYQEVFVADLDCCLPISVSVEDIFKREDFFFKFILTPSLTEEPIMLHSSNLTLNIRETESTKSKYEITGDYEPESPVILSSTSVEESCLNCYRLNAKEAFDTSDIFTLKIKYNTLRDLLNLLVTDRVLAKYCNDTTTSDQFEKWLLFWKYEILPLVSYDYKKFYEESVVRIDPRVAKSRFHEITAKIKSIGAMDSKVKTNLINLVRELINGISPPGTTDVDAYTKGKLVQRELSVPVSLPTFEQLYTVELQRVYPEAEAGLRKTPGHETSQITNVGLPVPFKVKIQNLSNKWSGVSLEENKKHIFEISSSNGEWFVQGKRRFALDASETNEVDLTLIPLKKGYLTFPQVKITSSDGVSSTIDYKNSYDSVLVL